MTTEPLDFKRAELEKLKAKVASLERLVADLTQRLEALEKWQQYEKELAMGEDL